MEGTTKQCPVCKLACALVTIGAINWGLVGILNFNLVTHFLGDASMATRVIYGAIGVAGLLKLISCFKKCPGCCKDSGKGGSCCGGN